MQISALYAAIAEWAAANGASDLAKTPGIWHGKTEKDGVLGPIDVRINPHYEAIDGIPFAHIMLGMDDYFPGIIGLVGPDGGTLMDSPNPGEDEAGLIAHFKSQTKVSEEV